MGRFANLIGVRWATLMPGSAPPEVLHLRQAESTNNLLKELVRAQRLTGPALLLADQQTAGRGTRGREWIQPWPRGPVPPRLPVDIALSLALPLTAAPDAAGPAGDPRLSLAVGAIAAQVLEHGVCAEVDCLEECRRRTHLIGVKWPNDLLALMPARHGKTGGILLETITADEQRWLIAGIGINVNSLPGDFPTHLAPQVSTLRELMADVLGTDPVRVELDALELAAALGAELGAGLLALATGPACAAREAAYQDWLALWLTRDQTPGTRYTLTREDPGLPVTAVRVDPLSGGLVVADATGAEYTVTSYTELEPGWSSLLR